MTNLTQKTAAAIRNNGVVNWKTTLFGAVAAASVFVVNDESMPELVRSIARATEIVSLALFGFFGRDGDKTSRQSGAE